jgi:hypothetical protein
MAWIDCKRAFDSLPHTWIVTVMETYQICPTVTIRGGIDERWKTKMWLYHTERHVKTGKVAAKWGIFQSDSFSPLLFYLALIPLTGMLNIQGAGYEVKGKK